MLSIDEAERIMKANKQVRGGQRSCLSSEMTKKQSTIAAAQSLNKSVARNASCSAKVSWWMIRTLGLWNWVSLCGISYCLVVVALLLLSQLVLHNISFKLRSGREFAGLLNWGPIEVQKLVGALGDGAFLERRQSISTSNTMWRWAGQFQF